MNRTGYILMGVAVLIIASAAVLVVLPGKSQAPATQPDPHADLIVVDSPKPGDAVSSTTVLISGKARGSWYFEASFPVQLLNASGTVIAQASAQAESDWMTTEFVPFQATLIFAAQPAGSHGTLVLKKDNPSGDPSKDDSISIPIVFQ